MSKQLTVQSNIPLTTPYGNSVYPDIRTRLLAYTCMLLALPGIHPDDLDRYRETCSNVLTGKSTKDKEHTCPE